MRRLTNFSYEGIDIGFDRFLGGALFEWHYFFFRPAADIFAIFAAPNFFRPMEAASAPGFVIPGFAASFDFKAANLAPEPSFALAITFSLQTFPQGQRQPPYTERTQT